MKYPLDRLEYQINLLPKKHIPAVEYLIEQAYILGREELKQNFLDLLGIKESTKGADYGD